MSRARGILATILVVAVVGGGIWYGVTRHNAPASLAEKILDTVSGSPEEGTPTEEAIGLAIKGINLFQGNGGIELWRLKASWAHISQQGDEIDVDKPSVQYALGESSVSTPGDDILDVKAQKGQVTDNQKYLTLWDDVVITRYDDTLSGPRMNYNATTRMINFPNGAVLDSPTGWGTAKDFSWSLAANEITASGDVLVILKARPEAIPAPPPSQEVVAAPPKKEKKAGAASVAPKTRSKNASEQKTSETKPQAQTKKAASEKPQKQTSSRQTGSKSHSGN